MELHDGFRHIKVTLLDPGPLYPFKVFWEWYRETWYSLRKEEYIGSKEQRAACMEVLAGTALPTPQEAVCLQVRVEGLSRVALAQFTRGRVGWAYCVTSQMPEAIEHEVIVPTNIYRSQYGDEVIQWLKKSEELYNKLIDLGIPPQDCRYITAHGQTTNLVCHINYMALRGYFARRCENGLTDELNLIGRLIRRELMQHHLDEFGNDCLTGSGWSVLIGKLDAMGGSGKCLNTDKVFGNTGRAPSVNRSIPSAIGPVECDWDFNKSAWYWELLSLPDDLLFPGEREMIEDWRTMGFQQRLRKLENTQKPE